MVRSTVKKVMWVGRATVFLVGLAVILALTVGVASMALAHTGVDTKLFHLGHSNTSSAITKLVGGVAGPMLRLDNNSTGSTAATALDLQVGSATADPATKTVAPMTVDSQAKVTNLNADKLDGQDSAAFLGATQKAADADKLDGRDSSSFLDTFDTAYDSDRLDRIDSTGFVKGANGRVRAGTVDIAPGTQQQVLSHFGSFGTPNIEVLYNCPTTLSNNGTLTIVNWAPSALRDLNLFSDHGDGNPNAYVRLGSQPFEQEAAATGEHITLQVQEGTGVGTIEVFSVHKTSGVPSNVCHVQAQGLFVEG